MGKKTKQENPILNFITNTKVQQFRAPATVSYPPDLRMQYFIPNFTQRPNIPYFSTNQLPFNSRIPFFGIFVPNFAQQTNQLRLNPGRFVSNFLHPQPLPQFKLNFQNQGLYQNICKDHRI